MVPCPALKCVVLPILTMLHRARLSVQQRLDGIFGTWDIADGDCL